MLGYLKLGRKDYLMSIVDFVREEEESREGELSFRQFEKVMTLMECKPEIKHLYEHYTLSRLKTYRSYTKPTMTKEDFSNFLTKEQGETEPLL